MYFLSEVWVLFCFMLGDFAFGHKAKGLSIRQKNDFMFFEKCTVIKSNSIAFLLQLVMFALTVSGKKVLLLLCSLAFPVTRLSYEWTKFCWLWGRGGSRPIQSSIFPWSGPMSERHRTRPLGAWLVDWRFSTGRVWVCFRGVSLKLLRRTSLRTPVSSLEIFWFKIQKYLKCVSAIASVEKYAILVLI